MLANQRGLATVNNNIANVNTEGYSRQVVDFAESTPVRTGNSFLGTGVKVEAINRAYDQFINDRLIGAIAGESQHSRLKGLADQIDNLLASEDTGLAPALDRFFSALSDVATDPSDAAARRAALTQGESLSASFRNMATRINELRSHTSNQIRTTVDEVNSRTASLAKLNAEIQAAGNNAPNNLLDQRDQIIRELAKSIGVTTVPRNTGAIDIFVAGGQPLVLGTNNMELAASTSANYPSRTSITLATTAGGSVDMTDRISGGSLAGLVEFRERFINPVQNGLGRMAMTLSTEFNAQHKLGIDLNGQFGGDFFKPLENAAPRVFFNTNNTGNASISAQITDTSALTASDYELTREGASYTITRLNDGTTIDVSADLGGGAPASTVIDGVRIELSSGSFNDGDKFLIQPTRQAAELFDIVMSDPARLAAAGPLQGRDNLDNTGSASISSVTADSTNNLPLGSNGGPISLTYDAASNEFIVSGGPGGTLMYDPAVDADGKKFSFPAYGDMEFTITGTPDDGDQLHIEDNTGAVGDNRNALALGDLQVKPAVAGKTSLNDAYAGLVADVGTNTRQAQLAADAQGARLDAARTQREAVAGVNLEEEAARLLQLQQSFQAAARSIATANATFQTLLRAVGG